MATFKGDRDKHRGPITFIYASMGSRSSKSEKNISFFFIILTFTFKHWRYSTNTFPYIVVNQIEKYPIQWSHLNLKWYEFILSREGCYGYDYGVLHHFQQYFSYIVRSVLLVEETSLPGENHRPAVSHWQTLSHKVVSSTPLLCVLSQEIKFEMRMNDLSWHWMHKNHKNNISSLYWYAWMYSHR